MYDMDLLKQFTSDKKILRTIENGYPLLIVLNDDINKDKLKSFVDFQNYLIDTEFASVGFHYDLMNYPNFISPKLVVVFNSYLKEKDRHAIVNKIMLGLTLQGWIKGFYEIKDYV